MKLTQTQIAVLGYLARFDDYTKIARIQAEVLLGDNFGLWELFPYKMFPRFARITAAGRQALARATGADKVRRGETAAQYASRNCATIAAMVRWAEGKKQEIPQ